MCSVRNAVRLSLIIVFNLDAFVLTVGLCSVLFVFEHVMFSNWRLAENFKKCRTFGTNDNLNRSLCPCLFSAEPSGNNKQRDIPRYLHMRRSFLLQLLPDMEEVYDDGSTSDEDERAIFITQQHGTLNTGEDSSKAGGLEDKGKFY